jgi:hypothetical protein
MTLSINNQYEEEVIFDALEQAAKDDQEDRLMSEVSDTEHTIENLKYLLDKAETKLADLQLQLINRTPTIKMLAAESFEDLNEDNIPF